MRKKTKALSGASQDAYFRRLLKAYAGLSLEERDRIVRQLREEIAQLRVRLQSSNTPLDLPSAPAVAMPSPAANPARPFDPFAPNVVVVLRTLGRDAVIAALAAIDSAEDLRLLAREQRLNVASDVSSAADIRAAIVLAAERRIANRVAAAT